MPPTIVFLTFNEERNLRDALDSLSGWATRLVIVDSGSTDATCAIARAYGAAIHVHPFETHAKQWKWALAQLPPDTDWVLGLDADQRLTPELRGQIDALIASNGPAVGAYVNRRQIFRGTWIRHGGYYPKFLLKLFRLAHVSLDEADLVDHHFIVRGPTVNLLADLIEDNRNEAQIATWTAKHNRYAVLQARQELAASATAIPFSALFGAPDDRVRWLKRQWARMPLFVRPCLYVFYRYVVRLGFLDGKQGFVFHVLQGFWYRLLIDVNIDELRSQQALTSVAARDDTTTGGIAGPVTLPRE